MRHFLPVLATLSLLTACQGASGPATPVQQPQDLPLVPLQIATGDLGAIQTMSEVSAPYSLTIRTEGAGGLTADLQMPRLAQAKGDAFALDATGFFVTEPCHDCLKVTGLRYGGPDEVLVTLTLRHPFALPPTPLQTTGRLDLHAFDVMGFILTEGQGAPLNFGSGRSIASLVLANADGYTDLYDAVIEPYYPTPDVTWHPYRVFFNDPTPGNFDPQSINGFSDPLIPQGHNVMPMGGEDAVDFALRLVPGATELKVGVAIGLAWGQPAQRRGFELGQRLNPVYYLPEFQHKAPWLLTATVLSSDLVEDEPASSAELEVRLRDWQLGATVTAQFVFGETPRDFTSAASELESLTLTIPGLLASPVQLDPGAGSGTGVYEDRVWQTLITNSQLALPGDYWGWIEATDSRPVDPPRGFDRALNPFAAPGHRTGTLIRLTVEEAPIPACIPGPGPGPIVTVLAAGQVPKQDVSRSNDGMDISGSPLPHQFESYGSHSRFAAAGNHIYVLAGSLVAHSWAQHLYVSADGGLTWSAGAILDQSFPTGTPWDSVPWPHCQLAASPDGTVYFIGQQGRPDFSNTELRVWSCSGFGTGPWVEHHMDPLGQKYSLTGAVDPNNPSHVIMVYRRNSGNTCTGVRSLNGPAGPWVLVDMIGGAEGFFGGDMFFAPAGRVYMVGGWFNNLSVRRSDDNGATWTLQPLHPTGVDNPFLYGTGAASPADPSGLTIAYAVRFANATYPGLRLFVSTNGGLTLPQVQGSLDGGSSMHQFPNIAFDYSGELVASYITPGGQPMWRKSSDLGLNFGPAELMGPTGVRVMDLIPRPGDCGGFFSLYQQGGFTGAVGNPVLFKAL